MVGLPRGGVRLRRVAREMLGDDSDVLPIASLGENKGYVETNYARSNKSA